MHYHLELIMPPTDELEKAVNEILEPYREGSKDEDGFENHHAFYDWYVIGGRWSGEKLVAKYPKEKVEAFYKELTERKITVSGLQWGKQSLEPSDQIPMVNDIWQKHFPEGGTVCPLFQHYNPQNRGWNEVDVCRLKDIPKYLTAAHVVVAGPKYDDSGLEIKFMIRDRIWNGVNYVDAKWDGNVSSALKLAEQKMSHYREEYKNKYTPLDDWLVVTVDYHT